MTATILSFILRCTTTDCTRYRSKSTARNVSRDLALPVSLRPTRRPRNTLRAVDWFRWIVESAAVHPKVNRTIDILILRYLHRLGKDSAQHWYCRFRYPSLKLERLCNLPSYATVWTKREKSLLRISLSLHLLTFKKSLILSFYIAILFSLLL